MRSSARGSRRARVVAACFDLETLDPTAAAMGKILTRAAMA